jgi:sec-independent protein translocase protein TatB
MFDITSSKLLLLGIIALLVVGPKELPGLLRTIGKYVGMIKRQAAEFRTQFDDAMRDSEIADLKKQVEDIGKEASGAIKEAETAFQQEMASVETETRAAIDSIDAKAADPAAVFTSDAVSPAAIEGTKEVAQVEQAVAADQAEAARTDTPDSPSPGSMTPPPSPVPASTASGSSSAEPAKAGA